MALDRKKLGQNNFDAKLQTHRKITEASNTNARDKQLKLQKKNAMGIFGALLLQAPAGRAYKLKLQNPNWTGKQLKKWLEIANEECETEASIITDDKDRVIFLDGCIMVRI